MKTKMRRRGGETSKDKEERAEGREEERKDERKHVGEIRGEHARATGGRAPRKGGGGVGANERPFSSAKAGEKPAGRHFMSEED